jgi:hypothetical protein
MSQNDQKLPSIVARKCYFLGFTNISTTVKVTN